MSLEQQRDPYVSDANAVERAHKKLTEWLKKSSQRDAEGVRLTEALSEYTLKPKSKSLWKRVLFYKNHVPPVRVLWWRFWNCPRLVSTSVTIGQLNAHCLGTKLHDTMVGYDNSRAVRDAVDALARPSGIKTETEYTGWGGRRPGIGVDRDGTLTGDPPLEKFRKTQLQSREILTEQPMVCAFCGDDYGTMKVWPPSTIFLCSQDCRDKYDNADDLNRQDSNPASK